MNYKENGQAQPVNEQKTFSGIPEKVYGNETDLPIMQRDDSLAVSAILLHKTLKVKTRFNDWFQRRVEDYGFEKEWDFYSNLSKSSGGRRATDYILTMDMAKELAMLENNEIGRKIRKGYINLEKRVRDWIGFILPRLTIEKDLFGFREGYNYVELLTSCQLSLKSGSRSARVRKNRQEFWRNSKNELCVSETYGKAIITNAIARRLNMETKERRLVYHEQKALTETAGGIA